MWVRGWIQFTAAALLVHAGLFAAMAELEPKAAVRTEPVAQPVGEVALDVLPDESTTPRSPEPVQPNGRLPPLATTKEAARKTGGAAAEGAIATRETGASGFDPASPGPEASPPPAGSGEGAWTFSPSRPSDVTAPGSMARAVGEIAREATPPPTLDVGGLRTALDSHDVSLGLGRGGPVLSALEAASRSMDVPIEGVATFDVAIDRSGHVSVALSDASTSYEAWSKVAAAAGAAVDVTKVRIPPGARGWRVAVRIDAHVQNPDGSRPKDLGSHAEAHGFELSKDSIVMKQVPGFSIATSGKVCGIGLSVQLGLPSITGGCNPGAPMPALRVVSGQIVGEGAL